MSPEEFTHCAIADSSEIHLSYRGPSGKAHSAFLGQSAEGAHPALPQTHDSHRTARGHSQGSEQHRHYISELPDSFHAPPLPDRFQCQCG